MKNISQINHPKIYVEIKFKNVQIKTKYQTNKTTIDHSLSEENL